MKSVRIISLLLAIICIFAFAGCKSSSVGTGKLIQNEDLIQYDITPKDPDNVVSAADDHKTNDGYNYEKADDADLIPTDEETKADGYTLTVKDEETEKSKNIASVYIEQGDLNILEIDIMTTDASDADLEAAVKLVRELISSSFDNFPLTELEETLPLSVAKIKALISNNVDESNTVYGRDTSTFVGYEYYADNGILIIRAEL